MLKVYRAGLLQGVHLYGEMHRFIPAYAAQEGARIAEIVVTHHPRRAGRSKYGISRTLRVVLDLIAVKFLLDYATRPIHLFGVVGTISCAAGIAAGVLMLYEKWALGVYVHRNPLILLAVFLFLLGVQCILMGLLAELLVLVCSELGAAAVLAIDLSRATDAAYENTRHRPNVHVVQADMHNLPLRTEPGDFDLVFSIGVLHHLPHPEAGFRALTRHLKPGGTVAAWVYGCEHNEWLVRYVNPIRLWVTSRLPRPLLYVLSFALALPVQVILKALYAPADRIRALAALRSRLPYTYLFWLSRFGLRHTHHVIFDHLAAPKADYLRREEFAAWFDRAGLIDKTVTARNDNSWRGHGRKPLAPAT